MSINLSRVLIDIVQVDDNQRREFVLNLPIRLYITYLNKITIDIRQDKGRWSIILFLKLKVPKSFS